MSINTATVQYRFKGKHFSPFLCNHHHVGTQLCILKKLLEFCSDIFISVGKYIADKSAPDILYLFCGDINIQLPGCGYRAYHKTVPFENYAD